MTDRLHQFKIGEWVDIIPSTLRSAAPGRYQIVRLIPCDSNEPRYCIRSTNEKHDRVVPEHDLRRAEEAVV
ncbi:hypothetical protein [Pseudorhodoplanes sp.]|uniref:hypothetical protein n=1 Tax=Pseudorhodoplanes sp. TaxID=1934341 RepID=UPI002C294486|nr:hypothetical protein [Pseudorhodoplanes sp.]HWV55058.1 hypothetical protein [Pseudorhodoplanes sp.]